MANNCLTLVCAGNATCTHVPDGITCRCNDGFKGDGYTSCYVQVQDDRYIFIIIFILLLVVGFIIIIIFLLCKRRIDDQPLVDDAKDAYDLKCDGLILEQVKRNPESLGYTAAYVVNDDEVTARYYHSEKDIGEPAVLLKRSSYYIEDDDDELDDDVESNPGTDEVDVAVKYQHYDNPRIPSDRGDTNTCDKPIIKPQPRKDVVVEQKAASSGVHAVSASSERAVTKITEDGVYNISVPTPSQTVNVNINIPFKSQESFLEVTKTAATTNV